MLGDEVLARTVTRCDELQALLTDGPEKQSQLKQLVDSTLKIFSLESALKSYKKTTRSKLPLDTLIAQYNQETCAEAVVQYVFDQLFKIIEEQSNVLAFSQD